MLPCHDKRLDPAIHAGMSVPESPALELRASEIGCLNILTSFPGITQLAADNHESRQLALPWGPKWWRHESPRSWSDMTRPSQITSFVVTVRLRSTMPGSFPSFFACLFALRRHARLYLIAMASSRSLLSSTSASIPALTPELWVAICPSGTTSSCSRGFSSS